MKLNLRKIIFVLLIPLSVLAIVYIVVSTKKKPVSPNITPHTPSLTQQYKGKYSIELAIDEKQFKYIESLPLLEITKSVITAEGAQKIAENLEFTGLPTAVNDPIDGSIYFWTNDKGTLFIYSQQNKIRYSLNQITPSINKQLSDQVIVATALNFLVEKQIIESDSLISTNLKFLKINPSWEGYIETTKEEATLFQVEFATKKVGYEIVSPSIVTPPTYVTMTKDGSINTFQSISFATTNSPTEYRLKNFKEIANSLDKSVLISLVGQDLSLSELSKNLIQKIVVNKIELAYLQESNSSTFLQPIYKLSGEAEISTSSNKAPVVLYLPAISGN